MTGILSREQEFLKFNEQLNNMTKYAVEKPQPPKIDPKFSTYTKKSPATVLRQSNVVDFGMSGKEKSVYNSTGLKDHSTVNGARKKPQYKDRQQPAPPPCEDKKQQQQFAERPSGSTPRHFVRPAPPTRNVIQKNPSNIVLRYKNSSFIQSPSLEVLVKEENESIRSQANSLCSEVSGLSTTRRNINLSSDGLEKYLKSRIAILQEEHETLTHEMLNQKDLVEKSLDRQKKIENQRDVAYTRNNTLTEQLTKMEAQLEEALRSAKDHEIAHTETQRHLDAAKCDIKLLTQTNANLEKRLYRANEELENATNTLNQYKHADKESKDSLRSESDSRDKQIKALKKQRADLLNAYKKQLYLIDNLKRQNLCMEQSRMIAFGEKEFTKVLDWQAKN